MDMPTFCIGRRSPSLHLWRRWRSERSVDEQRIFDDHDIEETSGLPRSLLDLISCINDPNVEEMLWTWKGHVGEIPQIHLWEAYRFAAILWARMLGGSPPYDRLQDLIVNKLMAVLDALYESATRAEALGSLTMNAIIYPLFTAGLAVKSCSGLPGRYFLWSMQIDDWLDILDSKQEQSNAQVIKELLNKFAQHTTAGVSPVTIADKLAYENDQEIALF